MNKRNKFLIRFVAIFIVLISVFVELEVIKSAGLEPYKYWMNVLAFGMLLITTR